MTAMKIRSNRFIGFFIAGVVGLTLGIGMSVQADRSTDLLLPLDDIRNLAQVIDHIKKSYVDEVDDKKLIADAIKGMLSGLDPHSTYLKAEDFSSLKEDTSGKFGGLGIEVQMDESGLIKVVAPIDDTPAARAGIRSGDRISALDGTPVKGMTLTDAVDIMRGHPGDPIVLTVIRKGVDMPLKISIIRDVIKVTSIKSELMEERFGYIRIRQFQERTGGDLVAALEKLQAETDLDGLILDLRNNPGGVLNASVDVVDAFISSGLIVYTQGRVADSDSKYFATSDNPSNDLTLIVLINGGSASASEIVAGALQDHKRGIIMGTQSFGKGSVQTILPLSADSAIKLTTARYYTPAGRSIQAEGITPDILVEEAKLTKQGDAGFYKEADLNGHLANPSKETTVQEPAATESVPPVEGSDQAPVTPEVDAAELPLAERDYQLYEAINLLKGITIAGQLRH